LSSNKKYHQLVVIGASAGGINAVKQVLSRIPMDFNAPIVIAQHMNSFMNMFFIDYLNTYTSLKVKEANHMELLLPRRVYYIPPNYHGLVEKGRLILNADAKVNYSRPSIDVLFESVALEENENAIGVILSGANSDGAYGMKLIKQYGGSTIIQNPKSAEFSVMPSASVMAIKPDHILDLQDIGAHLLKATSL